MIAIKGGGKRPWIEKTKGKANRGRLWIVGVDGLKSHLFSRLSRGQTIRFSKDLPPVWFEQIAAERRIVRRVSGQPVSAWERIPGRAAEALDCTVYAFAVRELINVNWAARAEQLRLPEMKTAAPAWPRVVQSEWMQGYTL